MRILNGRLRALTEEILVFWIGVRLRAVVADERWSHMEVQLYLFSVLLERFSFDCRKTKTKVNTLANQRA